MYRVRTGTTTTPGDNEEQQELGLKMHLCLKPQVCSFFIFYLNLLTFIYYRIHVWPLLLPPPPIQPTTMDDDCCNGIDYYNRQRHQWTMTVIWDDNKGHETTTRDDASPLQVWEGLSFCYYLAHFLYLLHLLHYLACQIYIFLMSTCDSLILTCEPTDLTYVTFPLLYLQDLNNRLDC